MSKSTLKLKYFTIFNVTSYYQNLNDDIMQEEEDIIDIIYEPSQESKFIFCYLLLLSKGTLMYFEYNTTSKKITNIYTNNSLSMITNELICSELSFNSPIIVATSLNELILVETNQKPCQMINITEEEIIICSEPLDSQILNTKFNCNQTFILVVTINSIKLFKIGFDKIENKTILQFYNDLILPFLNPNNDYSLIFNKKVFLKFSNFLDNILIVSYISDKPSSEEQIKLSFDSEELNDNNNNNDLVYLNLVQVNLSKKEISFNFIQCYSLDKTFVKIEFSYFYEKFFVLFEGGIICCLNNDQLNLNNNMTSDNGIIEISSNKKEKKNYDEKITFDNKIIFKYPLNSSNVKFIDMYIHPSSDFIVVRDSQSSFLIFDFTLNLYYIMYNSKISVKLNMDIFDPTEKVNNLKFKSYELNYFIKNSNSNFNIIDEFKIDKDLKNMILAQKIQNNAMFFYNSRIITGIFIEISSKFNQKNSLNPILDDFQLLKNHLRGQNFESSFKILMILNNFQQWIYSLFLITNKLCHHPQNILLIKRHSLSQALQYLKEKSFHDEEKNNTITNIRNLCFTNIVLRCLSIRQYEYAYLIIDKLQLTNLLKLLVSHCKLTKFLGINYLACTKLEENSESDENVITELNKIISSTNFTLSQNKLQSLIKDIDELIESDNLNIEYLKEYNSLEINLPKYYEGLQLEMEGKFEEAKELYRQNGLNYDYMRVEKLNKELLNQINEDSILEFNDIKLDKDN
jgi:hypothetical protein